MPKGGKKSSRKSNVDIVADVKLSDFADTSARNGRLKKSIGNLNQDKLKDLSEEPLWFEKDLEDFKLVKINGQDSRKPVKPRACAEEDFRDRPGVRYPPDLWFLLGGYIRPEQVRVFAAICKDAYHVSRSYSFWIRMYKRYFDPSVELPPRLQPECIEQAFCLRASVVRALHHSYPPFRPPKGVGDVGALEGLRCTLAWRVSQPGGHWMFYFKFQPTHAPLTSQGCGAAVQRLWAESPHARESLEAHVTHNPDEELSFLRFGCTHFVSVPPHVMGRRLASARLALAPDMRAQRLRLTFSTGGAGSKGESEEVEFDAVDGLAVLRWWHPQYPFHYF